MLHCSIINKRYLLKGGGVIDYIYLTNIPAIKNGNLFTDIIIFVCQVK